MPPSCQAFAPIKYTKMTTIQTQLHAEQQPKQSYGKKKKKAAPKYKTIGDMMKAMENNPDAFVKKDSGREVNKNGRRIDTRQKNKT